MIKEHVLFTTAPIDYDYGCNKELMSEAGDYDGKTVRLIECHSQYHRDYQMGRYQSGMYFTRTFLEIKEELNYSHLTLSDECKELINHES